MKTTLLLVCLAITAFGQTVCPAGQYLYNNVCLDNSCTEVYTPRFQTVSTSDGNEKIPITFVGEIALLSNNNIQVTLKFTDIKADGTMKRDNSKSCLDSQLISHEFNYVNPSIATNTITSSFDEVRGYRIWSFEVAPADWGTKFTKDTSTPNQIKYTGFYSYKFNVVGINQVQYYFQFSFILDTQTNASIGTDFAGLVQKDTATCNSSNNCIAKAASSLQFCADSACDAPTSSIKLYLNQNFWVIQKITETGFNTFGLKDPVVNFKGTGLLKKVTPKSQTNAAGQMIIGLFVEFVYNSVTVTVDSTLTTPNRRLLKENYRMLQAETPLSAAHARVESDTIDCIAPSQGAACATEAEVCAQNGWGNNCDPDSNYGVLMAGVLAVLLLTL